MGLVKALELSGDPKEGSAKSSLMTPTLTGVHTTVRSCSAHSWPIRVHNALMHEASRVLTVKSFKFNVQRTYVHVWACSRRNNAC